ncbi:MAG: SIS domain-containing protein [Clostridia bacterium]|nr:SIS domain-containing protein [Clostridia bacterium]
MPALEARLQKHIDLLLSRYPALGGARDEIVRAYLAMQEAFERGGKLLTAGNGGSAADSEHIVGELMKRFRLPRPLAPEFAEKLRSVDAARGEALARSLERPLTAIALTTHEALTTAFMNDVGGTDACAQQLLGFGRPGDVFLGISTSGNSENILRAAVVARALDMKVIGLTGRAGGKMAALCDVIVRAPETETFMVQEYHLPVYHCWCQMLEERFFGQDNP